MLPADIVQQNTVALMGFLGLLLYSDAIVCGEMTFVSTFFSA